MTEARKMAEEANRMGQEAQEQAQRVGQVFQKAAEGGVAAASRSFGEATRGFQAIAAEIMDYSKKAFDDAMRTWQQLIGVKSVEQAVEIQSQYAKRVYDNHMAELSKLGEMYAGLAKDASKPLEQASKRFT
jgi:hypothetical protein